MADLRVLGLDLSLNATGLCLINGRLDTFKPPPGSTAGMPRLHAIRTAVISYCLDLRVDVAALEGYSYASKQGAHQLGELGGVVRLELWHRGVHSVDIPPSTLKRYATGRGNASKDEMLVAAVRRLGVEPADNNQADAAWLRAAALDHYGHPLVAMPQHHIAALRAVTWPDLDGGS